MTENSLRRIQHPQGGVVSELNVREGALVRRGDVLLRLDEAVARSALEIAAQQLDEALARVARLEAERDQLPSPVFPEFLLKRRSSPNVALLLAAETHIQSARATARVSTREQLATRITQLRSEIAGLQQQEAARAREAALNAQELTALRPLQEKGLTPIAAFRRWSAARSSSRALRER